MEFEAIPGTTDIYRAVGAADGPLITDAQTALDLIATLRYHHGEAKLVLDKAQVTEAFFDLKTGIAGEVLQKFVNYQVAVAIVGDYRAYTSKSLRDFIRESNKGRAVFFVPDQETAVAKLNQ